MKNTDKPHVVVLGGGTGMPVLLQGLKKFPITLTAIVTVADDGGSTGKIRHVMDLPALGDVRNVINALSNVDRDINDLFQYRIEGDHGLAGHSIGNLLLAATNQITGDFNESVEKLSRLFNVDANIYPIVNDSVTLHAEMEDGSIVSGESSIPIKNKKIKRVYLTPEDVMVNEKVIKSIKEADLIVVSPGSLYTSILPNLIMKEVIQALAETEAEKVYVCNLMTQPGETNGYTASQHVQAIYDHTEEKLLDSIIVNNQLIEKEVLKHYEKEAAFQVEVDLPELEKLQLNIIEEDIIDYKQQIIRHNYKKIASILFQLARDTKEKRGAI